MEIKCTRYVFTYTSKADDLKDYILRSVNLADKVYGRDSHFARVNQIVTFARFLGWQIPVGAGAGHTFLEYLQEEPPQAIDHIFENQCKLLVDISPITKVTLEDGRHCSVRLLASTTAVGDLVWKLHLLTDKDGCPYVVKKGKKYKVKLKGTQVVAQSETVPYEEAYVADCFGGYNSGVWPVPFLPEFFSDRDMASYFSPEEGVVEVVKVYEPEPVHVLALEMVPWYRSLEIDRAKALPMDDFLDTGSSEPTQEVVDPNALVSGWDDLSDNEQFEVEETEESEEDEEQSSDEEEQAAVPQIINIAVGLNPAETAKLNSLERDIAETKITSKKEAEVLKDNSDPAEKARAEKWLLSALNRLRLLANCSSKLGALVHLLQKHSGQQILIIQPRVKWAAKLAEVLTARGYPVKLLDSHKKNNSTLRKFYEGEIPILLTSEPDENLFIDDLIVISVSAFSPLDWLANVNESHLLYTICINELGYSDHNLVGEQPEFEVSAEAYQGPALDILKIAVEEPASSDASAQPATEEVKTPKEPKVPKPKYQVKSGKGRPKSFSTYEKALAFARKKEEEKEKCEIFDPNGEACYVTGIGELNK